MLGLIYHFFIFSSYRLLVPEHNLPQLMLIPMLVGFFTYKAATVAEVFRDVLQDISQERNV